MERLLRIIFTLGVLGLTHCHDGSEMENPKAETDTKVSDSVIYGEDGRHDVYEIRDQAILDRAYSTVALVEAKDLSASGGLWNLRGTNFRAQNNLCASEPYGDQNTAAFCSGSLVGPDTVLTAGHCITSASSCRNTRFVFGFVVSQPGLTHQTFENDDVYECSSVVHTQADGDGADFAVVKLSRPVVGRTPLVWRRSGSVNSGDKVYVIGHPVGLPMKITLGGRVRKVNSEYFVANLDTYGGNSGSPVFNEQTGDLEGVLVRGDDDFVSRGGCTVSNRLSENGGRGEDVTRIDQILEYLSEGEIIPPPELGETGPWVSSEKLPIPDNSSSGIASEISVPISFVGKKVKVYVEIQHSYKGDLVVSLISPEGKTVVLHNQSGGSADNIQQTFDVSSFASSSAGNWQLSVKDLARIDVGELVKWQISIE